jgi:WD40 repeat protein
MSASLSANLESILDRFDEAWNGPSPPRIEDYLPSGQPADRLALLVELVRIDLERRLNSGERVRLERTYLPRFPELNADRASVVALAVQEFELRRRREPDLSPAEYFERLPQYREELTPVLSAQPTLTTNDDTCNGGSPEGGTQATQDTREVFALLSPPQSADEIGRLGKYRILKVLGSGGMGVVFLAEDDQLKRPVALKVMRPGLAANDGARQRFLREARAMAALKHDHIVTIYQVDEDRGVPFLAMEYLEGETLHARLKREPVLPLADALRIGGEIADALAAAHARGLIHRDIKPANIWLETRSEPRPSGSGDNGKPLPDGRGSDRVKLLDFGLVRPIGGNDSLVTQTGVILGTPAFMSPEQARGEKVDPRSDLFSLGCVLYRMVTGHQPFQGRDVTSTLLSLVNDHPKPPRQLNPQVPHALNHLIQRLLAKNIADRPSSAQNVLKALQTLDSEPEPLPLAPPSPQPAPSPPRPSRRALAALALFGMIALLGGIIIRIRSKDGRETTIEVPEDSVVTIEQKPSRERERAVVPPPLPNSRGSDIPPLAEGTEPLSPWALVQRPARLKVVRKWTIETRNLRGGAISCAMRPDGRQLATASFDGVIRLYDPSTGQLQQTLYGQQTDSHDCALTWSPDCKRLASSYGYQLIHIWNAATGQLTRTIQPPGKHNGNVAWSPDDKLLAICTNAGVTLWDTVSWEQVPFPVEANNVCRLAWSNDSKILATASQNKDVRLWEVPSGKLLSKFDGYEGWHPTLALSPDGNTLVFAASEKELRVWDTHLRKLLRTLKERDIRSAAFSPDGRILAVGTAFWGGVSLFDVETGKGMRWSEGAGLMCQVAGISWSPDAATLAAAVWEGHVSIFDVKTGKEVRRIESHTRTGLPAWTRTGFPAWSPDGKKIAAAVGNVGHFTGVSILDSDTGAELHRIETGHGDLGLSWSPSGSSLALHGDKLVFIYDSASGQLLRSWNAGVAPWWAFPTWSPDGKYLATVAEKAMQVWSAASGRLIHTLQGHTARIDHIAWSPDGKWIASGSNGDKTVRLWDAASGEQLHSFDAGEFVNLAWSPDGQSLASCTGQDTRTWDVTTKDLQVRCAGLLFGWSADSKAVMTLERNKLVRWWDRQTGELLRRLECPFLEIGSEQWLSPNSQFVTCQRGGALSIGDLSTGKFQLTFVPLRGGQWLAVRPDGHYRGSPGVEKEIVYVVQTDAGQEVLAPDEFAKKYGWKNDPESVRLPRHTVP